MGSSVVEPFDGWDPALLSCIRGRTCRTIALDVKPISAVRGNKVPSKRYKETRTFKKRGEASDVA